MAGLSPARGMRPTRRDLLVVILTLGLAYLYFSTPEVHKTVTSAASSSARLKALGLWHGSTPERSFDASVTRPHQTTESLITHLRDHTPGWTVFEKVYLYDNKLYVVTEDKSKWPELRMMTSTGLPADNVPGNMEAREPKGDEITYISPQKALELWGDNIMRFEGMSYLWNDGQFIDHYYHFAAELFLGTWRVHATLDPHIDEKGHSSLEYPARAIFFHQDHLQWRDYSNFNSYMWDGLFPNSAMLYPRDMEDLGKITAHGSIKKAYQLEVAILADRSAAFRGEFTGPTARTVASANALGTVSRWWWEPIRRQMLRFSGVTEDVIDRSLEGYGAVNPDFTEGTVDSPEYASLKPIAKPGDYKPVVTYISRPPPRRSLTGSSHAALVAALKEAAPKLGFELNIVNMGKLSKEEQVQLAARTTIMIGVHGNGLTHLVWMAPTPRSAVIELFCRGGFAKDYQWTAQALGIRHFAVQHDLVATSPNEFKVDYPDGDEGFQSDRITVDPQTVIDIIKVRLEEKSFSSARNGPFRTSDDVPPHGL